MEKIGGEERPRSAHLSVVWGVFYSIKGDDRMTYEAAHEQFLKQHLASRSGERRGRLERGHRHAEQLFLRNVIWPMRGTMDGIHPEYEVPDWRGRSYFADYVWVLGLIKLVIEIKGYRSHVQEMDRNRYSNELNRETFLHAMGYQVISFAYDDVEQRPELCIMLLRMVLSRYSPEELPVSRAVLAEKDVVRYAIQSVQPIRPKDVADRYGIDFKTAVAMLRRLCDKGWLAPVVSGEGERIVRYQVAKGAVHYLD
jgi:hypothetical protein